MLRALSTASSCYRARWSISKSTRRSYGASLLNAWLIYYDNAATQIVQSIWQFLDERNISALQQLPYSPGLALFNFFFSPNSRGSSRRPLVIKRDLPTEVRSILVESFQQCIIWKNKGLHYRGKSCSLSFGIEIKFLWYQSRYFSDTPRERIYVNKCDT